MCSAFPQDRARLRRRQRPDRKQFIWAENGTAGGVYQWDTIEDARAFYTGPWLDGIVERYGNYPKIEYFTTFAVCNALTGEVNYTEPKVASKARRVVHPHSPAPGRGCLPLVRELT